MVTARAVSSGGREGWVVMQRETFFAERWPLMVPQLRAALAKAGAGPDDRDDLVQETAVRLLGMWDRIDWERPVEALAQRIAVNAWRDQWRRRGEREQLGELPEQASAADTERAALARVQVGEVARAFTTLGEGVVRTLRL
ncbi:MAG TPA: sigma-70 family RNA polymerase sigma factor, partial [Mycobacteriales bacterium]|nr:sigma-70 family RNA polymerase sigma factor [Mycobacteriales bacterium]